MCTMFGSVADAGVGVIPARDDPANALVPAAEPHKNGLLLSAARPAVLSVVMVGMRCEGGNNWVCPSIQSLRLMENSETSMPQL